jgi:parvulin-like peptidyl-prolyl isomerase
MKKWHFIIFLLWSLSLQAETVDRIVAKVGGEIITLSDKQSYLNFKKLDFEFRYGKAAVTHFAAFQSRALNELVLDRILDQELAREKINISPTEIESDFQGILSRLGVKESDFVARMAKSGLTLAEYKSHLRRDIGKRQFIQKKIMPGIAFSELDLKQEYQNHIDKYRSYNKLRFIEAFLTPEKFSTEQDLVGFARKLEDELKRGVNVVASLKQFSSGAFAKSGGDSGLIDATQLRPEIRNILSRLRVGDVSPPIPFGQGVFIFKLMAQAEPTALPYSQVSQIVKADYAEKVVEQELKKYLMAVKDQTYVEIVK